MHDAVWFNWSPVDVQGFIFTLPDNAALHALCVPVCFLAFSPKAGLLSGDTRDGCLGPIVLIREGCPEHRGDEQHAWPLVTDAAAHPPQQPTVSISKLLTVPWLAKWPVLESHCPGDRVFDQEDKGYAYFANCLPKLHHSLPTAASRSAPFTHLRNMSITVNRRNYPAGNTKSSHFRFFKKLLFPV